MDDIHTPELVEAVFAHNITPLVVLDRQYNFLRVNAAYAKACRRDVAEFAGRNHFDMYPSDTKAIFDEVVRTKQPVTHISREFSFPDQPERGPTYWDWTLVPILDREGEVEYLLFSLIETTERRLVEDALRESEARYRQQAAELEFVYRTAPTGLCVLDSELRYVHINERLAELNGLPVAEHIGRTVREVLPEIADSAEPLLRQVLETGEPVLGVEGSTELPPGVERNWTSQYWPLKSTDGRVIGINVVVEDTTERKRLERAREREHEFRTLAENSTDIIARFDRELRRTYVNPAIEAILGRGRAELLGKTHREIGLPAPLADELDRSLREVFAHGRPRSVESNVPTPAGERFLESRLVPEFGPDGAVQSVLTITRDLTDRKAVEEALRSSERTYRTLVENLYEGIWRIDANDRTTFVNARMAELLGYRPEEMLGRSLFAFMPDCAVAVARDNLERGRTGLKAEYDFEFRRRDGSGIFTRIAVTPLFDEQGVYCGALAAVMDVTERERARAALKAYADGQDFLVDTAVALLRSLDRPALFDFIVERIYPLADGAIVLFSEFDPERSRTVLRAIGASAEELRKVRRLFGRDPIGMAFDFPVRIRERMLPGEFERLAGGVCELAFRQLPQSLCDRLEAELDIRGVYAMACSAEEDLLGTVALLARGDDLRQKRLIESFVAQVALALKRKRVEDALYRREQEFEALVERAPDIIARVDRSLRLRYINSAVERLSGRPRDWFLGKTPAEQELSAEEAAGWVHSLEKVFVTGQDLILEHRNPSPAGERDFQSRLTPEFGPDGAVASVLVVARDITDLKLAQRALEEQTLLDPLTGIANRRYLQRFAKREWRQEARHRHPVAAIMADIDHFKAYNDCYGHAQGDACLRQVTEILRESLHRPADTLVRYGGEEFIVLLPETDLPAAEELAERMRQAVEARGLPHQASPVADRVTVSLGVAAVAAHDSAFRELVAAADAALYRAKQQGRNRVESGP